MAKKKVAQDVLFLSSIKHRCRRAAPASCSRNHVAGYPAAAAAICNAVAAPTGCRCRPAVAPCAGPLEAPMGLGSWHNARRQQALEIGSCGWEYGDFTGHQLDSCNVSRGDGQTVGPSRGLLACYTRLVGWTKKPPNMPTTRSLSRRGLADGRCRRRSTAWDRRPEIRKKLGSGDLVPARR
jgi:hypothetical protein